LAQECSFLDIWSFEKPLPSSVRAEFLLNDCWKLY